VEVSTAEARTTSSIESKRTPTLGRSMECDPVVEAAKIVGRAPGVRRPDSGGQASRGRRS
jgi:hypothetical protein